jgi:20S proteasome alpha/beta subunit
MAKYKNARRLERVDDKVLIGAGGEFSDFQADCVDLLQANALEEQCMSGLYEPHSSNAKETWNYLRSVMYNRRNKMNPLWNRPGGGWSGPHGQTILGMGRQDRNHL